MTIALSALANERQEEIERALEEARNAPTDDEALGILVDTLDEIREILANFSVSEVSVDNLDQVRSGLHNELNRISKPILSAIKALKVPRETLDRIESDIKRKNVLVLDKEHDIQIIRRPKERLQIDNLADIRFPTSLNVNNLSELQEYFNNLSEVIRETFSVDIPTPQITVSPPQVNVPAPIVSVDAPNFRPLLDALDPLKFLSDRAKKPLSVRLSDGQKFLKSVRTIVENQQKQMTAFSQGLNEAGARKAFKQVSQGNIGGSGFKELTDATTAVQITTTSTACKWVDICANGGTAQIGDSTAVATVGGEIGVTLFVGQPYRVDTDNLNKVYAAGATNTRISWTYYV